MTNPTSNFGWQMPESTDLVTNLPADFEVFGQAVDSDFADLLGGTTGQVLSKTSATDLDFTWVAANPGDITEVTVTSPITGGGSSGSVGIAIQDGTTAQKGAVQLENSTSSTSTTTAAVPANVKTSYDLAAAAIPKSTVTTNGDLIYGTGSAAVTRLGIGSTSQVLTVSGGVPTWATPAGGGSGMTFIHRSSFTNVATVNYDYFNSTYYNYLVIVEQIYSSSSTPLAASFLRLRHSGTTITSGDYNGGSFKLDRGGGTGNTPSASATSFTIALDVGSSSQMNSYAINFEKVGNTSEQPAFHGTGTLGDGSYGAVFFGGSIHNDQTYTGFQLLADGSNITGTVSIYGLAKS